MAITFNGSNNYVQTVSNFTPPTTGSLSFWIRPTSVSGTRLTIGIRAAWNVRHVNGVLSIRLYSGSYVTAVSHTMALNTWYHVVGTYINTSTRQLFIDGALNNSATQGSSTPTANLLRIGTSNHTPASFHAGEIEDVRIYNRVLTAEEVETIYACQGTDDIWTGLLDRWPLNEGSSGATVTGAGSVLDVSDTANNCSPVNSPVYYDQLIKSRGQNV